jgi:hypothetical protein
MGRVVRGQKVGDFPPRRRGPAWDFSRVADGEVYLLRRGRDFDVQIESIRHAVRRWAGERGMAVETRSAFADLAEGEARERVGLYVRFVRAERERRRGAPQDADAV